MIKPIISRNSKTAGDALREVFSKDMIEGDFVLMQGDVVSNLDLSKVMREHIERTKKNKKSIMTMVFKKASPSHATRSLEDDTIIVINKEKRLIHFENSPNSVSIALDPLIVAENDEAEVRYDLIDTRIDICTKQVLSLFEDNFDYKDIRSLFIKEVLESEIYGNEIHINIIESEYAARVKDLKTYVSVRFEKSVFWNIHFFITFLNFWK